MRPLVLIGLCVGCATPPPAAPEPQPPRPAPALVVGDEPVVPAAEPDPAPPPDEAPPLGEPAGQPVVADPVLDPWRTPIGQVAGRAISVAELIVEWHQAIGADAYLLLDKLVATRLAYAEAERLGLVLEPADVDARVEEERARLDREARRRAPGLTTDEFVAREIGMDPARYRARLRAGVVRQIVAERVVRAFTLSGENLCVRLIVTADEAAMDGARRRLEVGDAFGDVAREVSVDDSAERGGRVPYLARQEGSALSATAFALGPGETSEPVAVAGHVFLVRLEERREPVGGPWTAVGEAVVASLARDPVLESEFLHWKLAMERRYPVDLRPILELIGAPSVEPETP